MDLQEAVDSVEQVLEALAGGFVDRVEQRAGGPHEVVRGLVVVEAAAVCGFDLLDDPAAAVELRLGELADLRRTEQLPVPPDVEEVFDVGLGGAGDLGQVDEPSVVEQASVGELCLAAGLRRLGERQLAEPRVADQCGFGGGQDTGVDGGEQHEIGVSAGVLRPGRASAEVGDRGRGIERVTQSAVGSPAQPHEDRRPGEVDVDQGFEEAGQHRGVDVVALAAQPVGQLGRDRQQHRQREPDARDRPRAALGSRSRHECCPHRVPGLLWTSFRDGQSADFVQRHQPRRQSADVAAVEGDGVRSGDQPGERGAGGIEHAGLATRTRRRTGCGVFR